MDPNQEIICFQPYGGCIIAYQGEDFDNGSYSEVHKESRSPKTYTSPQDEYDSYDSCGSPLDRQESGDPDREAHYNPDHY